MVDFHGGFKSLRDSRRYLRDVEGYNATISFYNLIHSVDHLLSKEFNLQQTVIVIDLLQKILYQNSSTE